MFIISILWAEIDCVNSKKGLPRTKINECKYITIFRPYTINFVS